ncbi:MAG: nuclear transport factor 2 family protein [Rhizobiaceae bacterium]|nr:nuclear transport factor 2 family protein [Rhizobiaceae bacterium]
MSTADPAGQNTLIETIETLEARRYAAMLASDVAALDEMLDDDLVYTHSLGDRDGKASYLDKVARGVFVYHEIHHTSDRIIARDGCAVVAGTMRATASVGPELRRIDNSCMAVWMKTNGRWRLAAYQPTPFRR